MTFPFGSPLCVIITAIHGLCSTLDVHAFLLVFAWGVAGLPNVSVEEPPADVFFWAMGLGRPLIFPTGFNVGPVYKYFFKGF